MKKIVYIALLLLSLSCQKENTEQKITTPSKTFFDKKNDIRITRKLSEEIMHGDTIAFKKLADIYFISGYKNDFLYYSIRIAEDYNYHEGYYTAFSILYEDIETPINKKTNQLAKYYLLKAYELGNKQAKRNLKSTFSKTDIPNSKEYWGKIEQN